MIQQQTLTDTTSTLSRSATERLVRAGVPARYMGASPRGDLMGGAYLYGKTGRGKTHAACGAIVAYVEEHTQDIQGTELYRGGPVRFVSAPMWFALLRDTYGSRDKSERAIFDDYAHARLLVLDDLGKGSMSEWATERIYMLLDYRCGEMLPTVVTSNYGLSAVAQMLASDEDTKQAIASRMLQTCDHKGIEMTGRDLRL